MDNLSLYSIKERAAESGRSVYSIQQLANLIEKPKKIAKVYSLRLVKKKLAKRIIRGKISFSEDEFIIASQLIEPSYISLNSALLFHNKIQQIPKNIECITTKNSFKFKEFGLIYHKISPSLFYGYKKYKKENSYIYVAEPEKALIDGIYLNLYSKKDFEELKECIDIKKLEKYIYQFKGRGNKKLKEMIKHVR